MQSFPFMVFILVAVVTHPFDHGLAQTFCGCKRSFCKPIFFRAWLAEAGMLDVLLPPLRLCIPAVLLSFPFLPTPSLLGLGGLLNMTCRLTLYVPGWNKSSGQFRTNVTASNALVLSGCTVGSIRADACTWPLCGLRFHPFQFRLARRVPPGC